jgi:peptidyl-prolyl cis-trans isomerase C
VYGKATGGPWGFFLSVVALVGISACQPAPDPEARVVGELAAYDSQLSKRAVDTSRVLATVNGHPIYREDLEAYLNAGLEAKTKDDVLEGVIRTVLLADEARRRGYARNGEVATAFKKALALELLVQKGHGFTEKSIDESVLRAAYEHQKRSRFVHGKKRTVVHALVRPPKGKNISSVERRIAAQIQKKVQGAQSESEFRKAVDEFKKESPSASIVVEKLPPFDGESTAFVQPFVKGAFGIAYPHERVSVPVETSYGIHVIFVESEGEASNVSFVEARGTLSAEMIDSERRKYVATFIETLEKKADIFVYDRILQESSGEGVGDDDR